MKLPPNWGEWWRFPFVPASTNCARLPPEETTDAQTGVRLVPADRGRYDGLRSGERAGGAFARPVRPRGARGRDGGFRIYAGAGADRLLGGWISSAMMVARSSS